MLPDNPYDGHTLAETLTTVESVSGVSVTDAYVDKGYRGHGYAGATNVHVAGQGYANRSRAERRRRRRRSAIEPKIGHLKSDHRMDRCFLTGLAGDATNAVLAAAGSNLRKFLRRLAAALIHWLYETMHRPVTLIPRSALPNRRSPHRPKRTGGFFRDD